MNQAIIQEDLQVNFELNAPIPKPRENEVIIRAVANSLNAIDWKGARNVDAVALHGELASASHRAAGKDIAGYVHAVGSKVVEFKVGDRVAALNHSSGYAEYSVGPAITTAHIPATLSFEDAATIPLTYMTAFLSLFRDFPTPTPWNPAKTGDNNPLVIYGASSAFGTFAARLASLANVHPIIAIAGGSAHTTVGRVLTPSRGDVIVDHRQQPDAITAAVRKACGPHGAKYAIDIIGTEETGQIMSRVLNPDESYLAFGVPVSYTPSLPQDTKWKTTFVPALYEPVDDDGPDGEGSDVTSLQAFATLAFRYLTFALARGLITAHPHKVMEGGLGRLEEALREHKAGRHGSLKHVFRIGDMDWTNGQL